MNVSTSGIGVDNNVLQGGDNDPAIATGDESFVINPEPLLSGVKVFIDNSVGGYDPGPGPEFGAETLYYNVYFEDGTFTGPTAVFDPDLSPEAGRQVSFVIESEGSNLIDAVQLTMGEGAIKIPVIEFTTRDVALANDVFLDFSTTLTDADSDTASTDFGVDLYGNEVDAAFDYTLIDHEVRLGVTDDTADAFDVDVALLSTADYLIQGFDPDPNDDPGDDELYDQLYLLNGSNGFTLNTGSDLGVGDPGINDSQVLVDGVTVIVEDATLRDIIDITEADTLIV